MSRLALNLLLVYVAAVVVCLVFVPNDPMWLRAACAGPFVVLVLARIIEDWRNVR